MRWDRDNSVGSACYCGECKSPTAEADLVTIGDVEMCIDCANECGRDAYSFDDRLEEGFNMVSDE